MRIDINFASRDYLLGRKAYAVLLLCIIVAAAVFGVCFGMYRSAVSDARLLGQGVAREEKRLADLDRRLMEIKKTVNASEVAAASKEAEFANEAIIRRTFSWTAFLGRIEEVVPNGVAITSVTPNFSTLDVDIAGTASDIASLTDFVSRLTASQYFEDIPPSFHTSEVVADKDIGKTVQTFNLRIRYYPEGYKGKGRPGG